jgi:hypothetical protein
MCLARQRQVPPARCELQLRASPNPPHAHTTASRETPAPQTSRPASSAPYKTIISGKFSNNLCCCCCTTHVKPPIPCHGHPFGGIQWIPSTHPLPTQNFPLASPSSTPDMYLAVMETPDSMHAASCPWHIASCTSKLLSIHDPMRLWRLKLEAGYTWLYLADRCTLPPLNLDHGCDDSCRYPVLGRVDGFMSSVRGPNQSGLLLKPTKLGAGKLGKGQGPQTPGPQYDQSASLQ